MRQLLLILASITCCTLLAQQKDSSDFYRYKYHIEEAKYQISHHNTTDAVKHLLLVLPADYKNTEDSSYQEALNLLQHIYYSCRNTSMKIQMTGYPSGVKYTDDGKYIGAVNYIGKELTQLYIFDTKTGQRVNKEMPEDINPESFCFSPKSDKVTIWSDNHIEEWDILTSKVSAMITLTENKVIQCEYSPCGTKLYVLLDNREFKCIYLKENKITDYDFENNTIHRFQLGNNGKRILIHGNENAQVWDLERNAKLFESRGNKYHAALSPEGNMIVINDKKSNNFVIDVKSRSLKFEIDNVLRPVFSADGKYIYGQSTKKRGTISIFDARNGSLITEVDNNCKSIPAGNSNLSFFVTNDNNSIYIESGLNQGYSMNHDGNILCIDISSDNSMAATCANDSTAKIWDVATGEIIGKPLVHDRKVVEKVMFSPDSKILASLAGNDNKVNLWDVKTGNALPIDIKHTKQILDMEFSPCGNYLVTSGIDWTIHRWDIKNGNSPIYLKGHSAKVNDVKYSPYGKYIYSASNDGSIIKWDAASGSILKKMKNSGTGVAGISLSNDGKIIASYTYSHRISIWDTETGKLLSGRNSKDAAHNGLIYELNFSKGGKWIASTSADSTLRVIDSYNGNPVCEPVKFPDKVVSAKFILNDSILAVSCWDSYIYFIETSNWTKMPFAIENERRTQEMALSPNGKFMATSILFNPLKLWKINTPEEIVEHYRETSPFNTPIEESRVVSDPQFYRSAYYAILASNEFDKGNYKEAKELLKNVSDGYHDADRLKSRVYYKTDGLALSLDKIYAASYSACGKYLFVAGDSTILVLNANDFSKVYEIEHNLRTPFPAAVTSSYCGNYFAVADYTSFSVFNLSNGELVYGPFIPGDIISKIKFLGNGKMLIEKIDQNLRLMPMSLMDLKTQKTMTIKSVNGPWDNSISDDGKYLIFSDPMFYTYLYEIGKENKLIFTGGAKGFPLNMSAISGNGNYFAYTTGYCSKEDGNLSNNILEIRDVKNKKHAMDPIEFEENIVSIRITNDGEYIYVLLNADKNGNQKIIKYRIGNGSPVFEYALDATPGWSYMGMFISKDGNYISVTGNNTVVIDKEGKLASPVYEFRTKGFSPCGNYLIDNSLGSKLNIIKLKGDF